MSDELIRLTKRRAKALMDVLTLGIDEEITAIEREYGITLERDGTASWDGTHLVTPDLEHSLEKRLDHLADAVTAARIFENRYT